MRIALPFAISSLLCMAFAVSTHKKVLLTEVKTITLKLGKYTTARRGSPVPQVKQVGGAAAKQFKPKVVQCYNRGSDGFDVQWQCVAEMPNKYVFGEIAVSCEGYDHPLDPFILASSCGLEYNLEYNPNYSETGPDPESDSNNMLFLLAAVIVVILVICAILRGPVAGGDDGGHYRPGPGGPGDFPADLPPPPYNDFGSHAPSAPPPPYNPNMPGSHSPRCSATGTGTSTWSVLQPGFWSGVGLGALGGYFMGSQSPTSTSTSRAHVFTEDSNTDSSISRNRRTSTSPRWTASSSAASSGIHESSSSTAMHESSGFGGTRRR